MSWTEVRYYSKIRSYFGWKYQAVAKKEGTPTTQQLVAYLASAKKQIDQVLDGKRPAKVIDPMAKAFSEVGWDWGLNKPKGQVPPTKEKISEMLKKLYYVFNDFEKAERRKIAEKLDPTEHDLESLDNGVDKLWELDAKNRLRNGVEYELDLQRGKKPYQKGDRASRPLFKNLSKEAINKRPTYKAFIELLDNYERAVGVKERETYSERKEINNFLNEVLKTPLMTYAHKWLVKKGHSPSNPNSFKKQLKEVWFKMYARGGDKPDSCGFEHVFVGEERNGKVIGCHNWIQIALEEKKGNINYLGWIYPRRRGNERDEDENLMTIQFEWKEGKDDKTFEVKPVSTSWVGVSPEFELALYTMCFLAGKQENVIDVGPYVVNIKCFTIRRKNVTYLSTSFPEEAEYTEKEKSYQRF